MGATRLASVFQQPRLASETIAKAHRQACKYCSLRAFIYGIFPDAGRVAPISACVLGQRILRFWAAYFGQLDLLG